MKSLKKCLSLLILFNLSFAYLHAESDMIKIAPYPKTEYLDWKTWKETKPLRTENDIDFSKISQSHPRLFFKDTEIDFIKNNLDKNPVLKVLHNKVINTADEYLNAPKLEYCLDAAGKRMISISRLYLKRISALAYAYKFTKDEKYLKAAEREMLNSASFENWNPRHFLDTAEMALSIAVGLDSLHNDLSQNTKDILTNALIEKALSKNAWGFTAPNNWNQVCNTCITCAAIVIFERDNALSKRIITRTLNAIAVPLQAYAPDGVYPEGVGYGEYGTTLQVLLIKTLRETFGTSFDLEKSQGFMGLAKFTTANFSHTDLCFNFSDSGGSTPVSPTLFWFANENNDLSILTPLKHRLTDVNTWSDHGVSVKSLFHRMMPLFLIDVAKTDISKIPNSVKKLYYGRGTCSVATIKTSNEPKIFVGIKAGRGSNGHGHIDTGSFVLDMGKYRWVEDVLILPYYEMERHKINLFDRSVNSVRWQLIRYNNNFHSTLTANEKNHDIEAIAPIVAIWDTDQKRGVKVDMTGALSGDVALATRSFKVINEQYFEITDTIKGNSKEPVTIKFPLPTLAKVKVISDNEIQLKMGNNTLVVKAQGNVKMVAKEFDRSAKHPNDKPLTEYNLAGFEYIVQPNEMATVQTTFKLCD